MNPLMGRYKDKPIQPVFLRDVGAMRRHHIRLQASCSRCGWHRKVDLTRLIRERGIHYSLIGRRPRCGSQTCPGHMRFLWSPGPSTPFRPLD